LTLVKSMPATVLSWTRWPARSRRCARAPGPNCL